MVMPWLAVQFLPIAFLVEGLDQCRVIMNGVPVCGRCALRHISFARNAASSRRTRTETRESQVV
eukprot:1698211-Prymnesium_polylepis.1